MSIHPDEREGHDADYVDLTPDGQEPTPIDESTQAAEELLDRLDFGAHAAGGSEPDEQSDPSEDDEDFARLKAERDELESKLLRTTADYQNYVRRSTREIEASRTQRVVDMARAMTTVLDHFDRALQVDAETTSSEEVLKGVASIREEMLRALATFGMERVEVEPGEEFDPNRHEALMHQQAEGFESGQVTQTLMPGYFVNDTPVRPAQVAVAQ